MARLPRGKIARAAVFLVTVIVVAGVVSGGGVVRDISEEEASTYPEFTSSKLIPEQVDSEGAVSVGQADEQGMILVDLAHDNRVDTNEIQPLLSGISQAGYDVEFVENSGEFKSGVSRADALVVIDPGTAYSQSEVDVVEQFVDSGGRLLMVGEPTRTSLSAGLFGFQLVPVRNELAPLSTRFGFKFGEGYLYNMEKKDGNFQNIHVNGGTGPLSAGVDRAVMYTSTNVESQNGISVLEASQGTRNVRGDIQGEFSLAVQDGDVLAIGDKTFIEGENHRVADNERFLSNIVEFLVTGDRTRSLLDYPVIVDQNPTIQYTSIELLGAAQTVGSDLQSSHGQPELSLERNNVNPSDTDVLVTTYDFLEENQVDGTGITARIGRVSVPGYESDATGIYVIRGPMAGFDVVIAADTPNRAEQAADALVSGQFRDQMISNTTVVVRTAASGSANNSNMGT